MTKEREALKLALEALKDNQHLVADNERHAYVMKYNNIIEKCEEVLAQPPEERNFCPRCGKRAGKNAWDVHTCSLPEENT